MKSTSQAPTSTGIVFLIIQLTVSIGVIVFAILGFTGIWQDAGYLYVPLSGIQALMQAIQEWKKRRAIAILCLCAALFIFAVYIAELFI